VPVQLALQTDSCGEVHLALPPDGVVASARRESEGYLRIVPVAPLMSSVRRLATAMPGTESQLLLLVLVDSVIFIYFYPNVWRALPVMRG